MKTLPVRGGLFIRSQHYKNKIDRYPDRLDIHLLLHSRDDEILQHTNPLHLLGTFKFAESSGEKVQRRRLSCRHVVSVGVWNAHPPRKSKVIHDFAGISYQRMRGWIKSINMDTIPQLALKEWYLFQEIAANPLFEVRSWKFVQRRMDGVYLCIYVCMYLYMYFCSNVDICGHVVPSTNLTNPFQPWEPNRSLHTSAGNGTNCTDVAENHLTKLIPDLLQRSLHKRRLLIVDSWFVSITRWISIGWSGWSKQIYTIYVTSNWGSQSTHPNQFQPSHCLHFTTPLGSFITFCTPYFGRSKPWAPSLARGRFRFNLGGLTSKIVARTRLDKYPASH